MTASHPRHRRALVIPAGMAMATALAFLPNTAATAAPTADTPAAAATDGTPLSYVVNIKGGNATSAKVKKAIAKAGGTVVASYDKIGVIVAHSSNADFARTMRTVHGVQSAGATRNAPLPSAATTDLGAPKVLSEREVAEAASEAAAGQDPLQELQWDLKAIKADKAHEKSLGSPKVTVGVIDTGVD